MASFLKIAAIPVLLLAFCAAPATAADWECYNGVGFNPDNTGHWDNTSFKLDNGTLVITHRENRYKDVVEITRDHELYVNDERIKLDKGQQELVDEFYDDCMDMYDQAKRIGVEGAKIGLDGAKLGLKAVGCVFKLLSPNYDTDDLEREMDYEASKIEAKADKLEIKADRLEKMAEELEDVAHDMRRDIPAIDDLGWF